jgi:hypothetical protein
MTGRYDSFDVSCLRSNGGEVSSAAWLQCAGNQRPARVRDERAAAPDRLRVPPPGVGGGMGGIRPTWRGSRNGNLPENNTQGVAGPNPPVSNISVGHPGTPLAFKFPPSV